MTEWADLRGGCYIPSAGDRARSRRILAEVATRWTWVRDLTIAQGGTVSQAPTIGRIVHYTLNDADAAAITAQRADSEGRLLGNRVAAGQTYPALIVRTWGDQPDSAVQLRVVLDGNDTYWATSRTAGEPGDPGRWAWPPRV